MAAVPQRAPHREPQSSDPPPTLPPRPGPGGRVPFRPPPVVPPADSDDDSNADDYVEPGSDTDGPDILYDDFNEGDDQDHANWNAKDEPAPPPLPPHPELEEITYDDCEEPALPPQPPLPKRPPARLPPIPPVPPIPETYDDVENVGPVVVKPPKTQVRQLPPPPVQPTKVEDVGDVYEDPDASKPDEIQKVSAIQSHHKREWSPTRTQEVEHSWSSSIAPNASPARNVSPSRLDTQALPPATPHKGHSEQDGKHPGAAWLPPAPPPAPRRSPSPALTPAVRSHHGARDSSPVVVPLKTRNKGNIPPPPQREKQTTLPHSLVHDRTLPPVADKVEPKEDGDVEENWPDLPTTDKNPESVYEVGDPEEEEPHQLPPSIDRPEHPPPLLPGKPSAAKTAGGAGAPGFAMNIGQLQNVKQGLRKVSLEENTIKTKNNDPKVYGDYPQSVADVKKKFQEKQGKDLKPDVSPKPALLPKSGAVKPASSGVSSSNNVSKSHSPGPGSKPSALLPPAKLSSPSTPDVTFLHKPNKEKPVSPLPSIPVPHPNSKPSVPVLPPNSKPVTKFEPLPPKPDDFEDQEIYDDACSESELTRYDWYHGSIDRMKGEQRVKSVGKDGTYLVRVSEKDPHFPYTLVVLHKGHVNNLRIRLRHDKKFALGDEKTDELAFADVIAMINHHKNHHVVLLGSNQSQVKLQFTPAKK